MVLITAPAGTGVFCSNCRGCQSRFGWFRCSLRRAFGILGPLGGSLGLDRSLSAAGRTPVSAGCSCEVVVAVGRTLPIMGEPCALLWLVVVSPTPLFFFVHPPTRVKFSCFDLRVFLFARTGDREVVPSAFSFVLFLPSCSPGRDEPLPPCFNYLLRMPIRLCSLILAPSCSGNALPHHVPAGGEDRSHASPQPSLWGGKV